MELSIERLMRAAKALTAIAHDIAIPKDMHPPLTPGELGVMSILVTTAEPVSITELVKKSQLAQSRVSSVVRSLDERGWVLVSTPTHDRRSTMVQAKKAVIEGARRVVKADIGPKLAGRLREASAVELQAILAGIDALLAALDRSTSAAADAGAAPRARSKRRQ